MHKKLEGNVLLEPAEAMNQMLVLKCLINVDTSEFSEIIALIRPVYPVYPASYPLFCPYLVYHVYLVYPVYPVYLLYQINIKSVPYVYLLNVFVTYKCHHGLNAPDRLVDRE